MRPMLLTLTLSFACVIGIACDDRQSQQTSTPPAPMANANENASAAAPAHGAATQAAASEPATRPAVSHLTIAGKIVPFPPAVLRLEEEDGNVVALVFSDDPKTAIDDGYDGNSYYLRLPLELDDPANLSGARWTYKANTSEPEDSPYGVFLEGRRWQLHPDDVRVEFEGSPDGPVTVWIGGTFLAVDTTEAKPSDRVKVMGKLTAFVQPKKKG
jgi:hypothetical protein